MAEEKLNLPTDAFEPLPKDEAQDNENIAGPSLSFAQNVWLRFKQRKAAMISAIIVIVMIIVAFGSTPFINNATLVKSHPQYANLPAKVPGMSAVNGLNGKIKQNGKWVDAYAQNNVPKEVDNVMQRIIEIISSVPNLIIVVLMLVIFKPGIKTIILAIAISSWTTMARQVRAETLSLKNEEYVLAARSLGESSWKIAWKHLVPNLSSIIIIQTMYTIPTAIFFEAFLSFIGIGISAPQTSLGVLLNEGQKNFQFLPYQMWYPAIVLCILMIAFNLLGDGLRDAFDPRGQR